MGLYNTSRAQLAGGQVARQPSWSGAQQAPAPTMRTMGGDQLNGGAGSQNPGTINMSTPPAFRGGLNSALSRPSQTANIQQNYQASNPYYQPQQPQAPQGPPMPSFDQIQQEQARQNVGVQLNQNPGNSALAGYMFG